MSPDWLQNLGVLQPANQAAINSAVLADNTPQALSMPMSKATSQPQMPMPQTMPMQAPMATPKQNAALQKYIQKPPTGDQTPTYQALSQQALADQKAQLAGLNQYINDIAAKPRGVDLSALAAYVDSTTGSKLYDAVHAAAPMSEDDRDKMLFGLKNQLAQGTAKLSADQLKALQEQQAMNQYQRSQEEKERHDAALEALASNRNNSMSGTGLSRVQGAIDRTEAVYDKDPTLVSAMNRRNQIATDYHTLTAPGAIINNQTLHEITGGIATALQGGKSAGLGQQQMQGIRDAQTQLAGIEDFLTTNPHTALSEGQRQNLVKILDRLDNAYSQIQDTRVEQIHKGRHFVIPEAQQASDDKYQSYKAGAKVPVFSERATEQAATQHPQVNEALEWAKANSSDPRAQAILKKFGG